MRSVLRAALFVLVASPVVVAEPVQIVVLEGLTDKSWDVSKAQVTDLFEEPAFGLTQVPTKYSPKAIAMDRSSPFLLRATQTVELPAGDYRIVMRSRGASRLYIDGKLALEIDFPPARHGAHENVKVPAVPERGLRLLMPGQRDKFYNVKFDGMPHDIRWELIVGGQKLRAELGDAALAIAKDDGPYKILSQQPSIVYDEDNWNAYAAESHARRRVHDAGTRMTVSQAERKYWAERHELARELFKKQPPIKFPDNPNGLPANNPIDAFLNVKLAEEKVQPLASIDDDTFLRRLMLDTVGVIPTAEELDRFRKDTRPNKRQIAIETYLADARWADHWVSYWQDVLAENPGILKPTLNNTGPFRWWLHQALSDNLPMDRFVTELVMMEGSVGRGGPSGFGIAAENDAPMAAKAQVLARAFLAADLTCARCHDAPMSKSFLQEQLFTFAAMLEKKPLAVPASSTVKFGEGGRQPAVKVTLKPGVPVPPTWKMDHLASGKVELDTLVRNPKDSRETVAAIITSPENDRFAKVLVNRVWKRFFGLGLVEPVDDWRSAKGVHGELLDWLARELMTHDYDLKHIAGLILNSHAYQRSVVLKDDRPEASKLFAGTQRRRLSAEQLVDSLFVAAGLEFCTEELNFDPDCRMNSKEATNLGAPKRAWQFSTLGNERDRPALALPIAQTFVDLLTNFGWRDVRSSSQTLRDEEPMPLQPLILGNGMLHRRVARLSDQSAFTQLSLEDRNADELVRKVFDRIMTRSPTAEEMALFQELLSEGYQNRRTGLPAAPKAVRRSYVAWSNHLSPEASRMKLEEEQVARAGDRVTPRLQADWRMRMEDMVWALLNSPEFMFVP